MRIRGLLTIFGILLLTAIINREYLCSGIAHSGWSNIKGNEFGFEFGMLDLLLIFLCLLVAYVNNERRKLNEVYNERFNLVRSKYLEEEQEIAQLAGYMEGCRGRYTNTETPIRKVNRTLVSIQKDLVKDLSNLEHLCEEFEELKRSYQRQSQSYPINQAEVMTFLGKKKAEVEIACLKDYIEREVADLQAEMEVIRMEG